MIIEFEGIDASGKATQSKLVASAIGGEVVSFPAYDTVVGRAIKANLTQDWSVTKRFGGADDLTNALVLQCMMIANRLELLPRIAELQRQHKPVVFDRWKRSAEVYGALDGLDPQWLRQIQGSLPDADLHVLIDVDPAVALERRPERRDRYEKQPGLMAAVRAGYLKIWREHERVWGPGERNAWIVVDGDGTINEITDRVFGTLMDCPTFARYIETLR